MSPDLSFLRGSRHLLFPRSLRYQLLSRILLILAGLLLVIGLFQFLLMEKFLYQNKAEGIQSQIRSIPGDIWERFNPSMRRGPAAAFIFFPSSSVAFINAEGNTTVLSVQNSATNESVPRLDKQLYNEALEQKRQDKPLFRIVNDPRYGEQLVVLQAVRSFRGSLGVVQVSSGTKPLKDELYRQLLLFLFLAFTAMIGGLLAFLPAIRRTLNPLSRMVSTVERIDSGKLSERLPEERQPMEIDRLSRSFNSMLERLESSFLAEQEAREQMRRFVSDASHELRTPLTSIHGFLEVLLRGAAEDREQLNKALRSMYGESERINKLVYDLLQLAQLDRSPHIRLEARDLSRIVEEMEPQLRILAGERKLIMELNGQVVIPMDQDKMKQIVLNLFHNAVQHTDPMDGRIRIVTSTTELGAELTILDNGSGIADEHLPHLFDRFYRIETSRARKFGGAGLGLSITRALVELHGGSVNVKSRLEEGSSFTVFFPNS
jgi:two-component system OmpR family sensor kinase